MTQARLRERDEVSQEDKKKMRRVGWSQDGTKSHGLDRYSFLSHQNAEEYEYWHSAQVTMRLLIRTPLLVK